MAANTSRLMSTAEAAEQLGITPQVIYEWARGRRGRPRRIRPAARRGTERLWDVDELLDLERDTRKKRASTKSGAR